MTEETKTVMHALAPVGAERDALRADNERLTRERDEARDEVLAKCSTCSIVEELTASLAENGEAGVLRAERMDAERDALRAENEGLRAERDHARAVIDESVLTIARVGELKRERDALRAELRTPAYGTPEAQGCLMSGHSFAAGRCSACGCPESIVRDLQRAQGEVTALRDGVDDAVDRARNEALCDRNSCQASNALLAASEAKLEAMRGALRAFDPLLDEAEVALDHAISGGVWSRKKLQDFYTARGTLALLRGETRP